MYYIQIEGVKYNRTIIEMASDAAEMNGDGTLHKADSIAILDYVQKLKFLNDPERLCIDRTLYYVLAKFKWHSNDIRAKFVSRCSKLRHARMFKDVFHYTAIGSQQRIIRSKSSEKAVTGLLRKYGANLIMVVNFLGECVYDCTDRTYDSLGILSSDDLLTNLFAVADLEVKVLDNTDTVNLSSDFSRKFHTGARHGKLLHSDRWS